MTCVFSLMNRASRHCSWPIPSISQLLCLLIMISANGYDLSTQIVGDDVLRISGGATSSRVTVVSILEGLALTSLIYSGKNQYQCSHKPFLNR